MTFHRNFAYEDFVEGVCPVLNAGALRYERHEGLFKRMSRELLHPSGGIFVQISDTNLHHVRKLMVVVKPLLGAEA